MENFITLTIGFWMAFITFYVNQRIHKMRNIKIIINSLFQIYGTSHVFEEFEAKDIPARLMDEIINIEKLSDDNFYIDWGLEKLRALRFAYFEYLTHNDKELTIRQIENIKFAKLDKSFIILAFLDIKIPYIYVR